MSINFASFSVGRHRNTKVSRTRRELFDQASDMLAVFSQSEIRAAHRAGAPLNVRFIGPDHTPTLYRGELPADSKWAGVDPAEAARARAKVRAVIDAASKPMLDARARIVEAKRIANEAWERR